MGNRQAKGGLQDVGHPLDAFGGCEGEEIKLQSQLDLVQRFTVKRSLPKHGLAGKKKKNISVVLGQVLGVTRLVETLEQDGRASPSPVREAE